MVHVLSDNGGDIERVLSHFASLVRTEHQEEVFDLTDRVNALYGSLAPSDDIRSPLCDPVSRAEVRAALTRMNKTTVPGPDGILTGFYSTFFDVRGGTLRSSKSVLRQGSEEGTIESVNEHELTLHAKALFLKTCAAAYAYVARIAPMPRRISRQLSALAGRFLWDGKQPWLHAPC